VPHTAGFSIPRKKFVPCDHNPFTIWFSLFCFHRCFLRGFLEVGSPPPPSENSLFVPLVCVVVFFFVAEIYCAPDPPSTVQLLPLLTTCVEFLSSGAMPPLTPSPPRPNSSPKFHYQSKCLVPPSICLVPRIFPPILPVDVYFFICVGLFVCDTSSHDVLLLPHPCGFFTSPSSFSVFLMPFA